MRLISAVLGFALRKLGLLGATVLSLFVAYLALQALVPPLQQAVADRDRLERVSAERATVEDDLARLTREVEESRRATIERTEVLLRAEVDRTQRSITDKRAEIERLRAEREDVCGFWSKVGDLLIPGEACESAEAAVAKAGEALDTFEASLARAEADTAVIRDPDLTAAQKLTGSAVVTAVTRPSSGTSPTRSRSLARSRPRRRAFGRRATPGWDGSWSSGPGPGRGWPPSLCSSWSCRRSCAPSATSSSCRW